jgi:two-component system sensor histidine kinase PhoQ
MRSLQARVALSAGIVLALFVVLNGLALDRAFREGVAAAREERLLGQLYLLMAAADADEDDRLSMPDTLTEARFGLPGSGLYGRVAGAADATVWRSPSSVGLDVPFHGPLAVNERRFERRASPDGAAYLVQSYGVLWATGATPAPYTFSVAEDLEGYETELSLYRRSLFLTLALVALLLLAALAASLRWGLRPLRSVEAEVAAVERGEAERLVGAYPAEVQRLVDRLNTLLTRERAMQRRLRNALGDLAHSLKTPLAVLRGLSAERDPDRASVEEQLRRLQQAVDFQLQRALAGSTARLPVPLPVRPVAERVLAALSKLYGEKGARTDLEVPPDITFRGGEEDLMELLGNLAENAFKWCHGTVRVRATRGAAGLSVTVEDDGPGIDPADAGRLLERGVRADETVPGHGIGLAVVREVAEAYGGSVTIGRSDLGGASLRVELCD